jgi:uroporphyrinogen decarboxylase
MGTNSRERVLAAIHLREPDRTPLDVSANTFVTQRLHRDLGTSTHKELLQALHVDVIDLRGVVDPVYRGPVPFTRDLGDGVRESIWGWRQKVMQTAMGQEDCFVDFCLSDAQSVADLERHRWPSPDWFDFTGFAERLRAWEGFAIMASGASVFQHPTFLRGIDNLMVDMALRPEMAHYTMDRHTDFYLAFFDRMLSAARGRIDVLRVADDLGMQHGLQISPAMYHTYFAPRLAKLADLAHSHGAALMFHSCGAIRPLVESLIEVGVDVLDPLQAAADGMDPEGLKVDYGDRVCLHGGICTQHLLPHGTPDEVRTEVKRRIGILGRGGGYILAPCHVLQTDVPTENILAMIEAALQSRHTAARAARSIDQT